jgi:hypothetical protein
METPLPVGGRVSLYEGSVSFWGRHRPKRSRRARIAVRRRPKTVSGSQTTARGPARPRKDHVDHVHVVTEPEGVLPVERHQGGEGNGTDPGRPWEEHLGQPKH